MILKFTSKSLSLCLSFIRYDRLTLKLYGPLLATEDKGTVQGGDVLFIIVQNQVPGLLFDDTHPPQQVFIFAHLGIMFVKLTEWVVLDKVQPGLLAHSKYTGDRINNKIVISSSYAKKTCRGIKYSGHDSTASNKSNLYRMPKGSRLGLSSKGSWGSSNSIL